MLPYEHAVTFNSNGVDSNRISTGAKDDMDFATVQEIAPIARRMGVETFILDDGWQARSGDWQPDSPQYPEPRWDGTAESKFKPRFPDAHFGAVRRGDRADEARPVDEPDVLQPVVGDVRAASGVGVPPGRRRAAGVERGGPGQRLERGGARSVGTGRAAARREPHPARRSSAGECATSSSTSWCGSTASVGRTACATCTSSTTRSWRCSTGCARITRRSCSRSTRRTTTGCSRSSRSRAGRRGSRTAGRTCRGCCTTCGT